MTDSDGDFDYSPATVPKGAIFVAADEPLLVFPSTRAAEQYLEVSDVEEGTYPAAYGPQGQPHRVTSDGTNVYIERSDEPDRPDDFKALLLKYLAGISHEASDALSVEELVEKVWAFESEFWQTHDPYGDRFSKPIPRWGCVAFVAAIAAVIYFVIR